MTPITVIFRIVGAIHLFCFLAWGGAMVWSPTARAGDTAYGPNAWIEKTLRQQRRAERRAHHHRHHSHHRRWYAGREVISHREARRRSTIEFVPVTRHVPLRYVPGHYERVHRRHRHHAHHHHHRHHHHGDARCHDRIAATGTQAQSEAEAFNHAVTAWKGRVRFRYGERYTNFDLARGPRRDCAPSSVADSTRDKTLPQLYRCELSGRPCRAEAERVGREGEEE